MTDKLQEYQKLKFLARHKHKYGFWRIDYRTKKLKLHCRGCKRNAEVDLGGWVAKQFREGMSREVAAA